MSVPLAWLQCQCIAVPSSGWYHITVPALVYGFSVSVALPLLFLPLQFFPFFFHSTTLTSHRRYSALQFTPNQCFVLIQNVTRNRAAMEANKQSILLKDFIMSSIISVLARSVLLMNIHHLIITSSFS